MIAHTGGCTDFPVGSSGRGAIVAWCKASRLAGIVPAGLMFTYIAHDNVHVAIAGHDRSLNDLIHGISPYVAVSISLPYTFNRRDGRSESILGATVGSAKQR